MNIRLARSLLFPVTAIATLLTLWFIGLVWFSVAVMTIAPADPALKTDAIIVLTGGQNRIPEGLKLLNGRKAEKLLISGVNNQVKVSEILALEKANPALACCVTLGYQALDTKGNASETLAWVRENNIRSLRLVTANYHILRAGVEFHNVMPDIKILHHPVEPPDFKLWAGNTWKLMFTEYNKLLLSLMNLNRDYAV